MTELVSNALKHGFPDGRPGTISLSLVPAKGQLLSLSVCDDGVGLPAELDTPEIHTLGLNLVSRLAGQLHGELVIDKTRPVGALFSVVFPAPESLSSGETS